MLEIDMTYYIASVKSIRTHFTEPGKSLWLCVSDSGRFLSLNKEAAFRFSEIPTDLHVDGWNNSDMYWFSFDPSTLTFYKVEDEQL